MTKQELGQKLEHLDPGATLKIEGDILRAAFADTAGRDLVPVVEAFAVVYRCSFSPARQDDTCVCFEKDDVF